MSKQATHKAFLRIARFSCAVAMYNAYPTGGRLSSHRVNAKTGNRIEQVMKDQVTGETVGSEDLARGFEVSRDRYVVVTDEEIDAITPKWDGTIDIDRFVPQADLDVLTFDGAHHLAPDGRLAEEGFALLRRSMRDKEVAAIATMVIGGRRRYLAVLPRERTMLAMTMRFPYEIRGDKGLGGPAPDREIPAEHLGMMSDLIDGRTKPFSPGRIRDTYEEALVALVKRKTPESRTAKGKDMPIGDALRESVRRGGAARPGASKPGKVRGPKRARPAGRIPA